MLQQTCKVCNRIDKFDYSIPDEIWSLIVPLQFRNKVVCLCCFDDFAREQGIAYAYALQGLIFAGHKACFEFRVKQAIQVNEQSVTCNRPQPV